MTFVRRHVRGRRCRRLTLCSNAVTFLNDNFVHRSFGTVFRRELALLDAADNIDVVAFFVSHRNIGDRAIKGEIEPVGLLSSTFLGVVEIGLR